MPPKKTCRGIPAVKQKKKTEHKNIGNKLHGDNITNRKTSHSSNSIRRRCQTKVNKNQQHVYLKEDQCKTKVQNQIDMKSVMSSCKAEVKAISSHGHSGKADDADRTRKINAVGTARAGKVVKIRNKRMTKNKKIKKAVKLSLAEKNFRRELQRHEVLTRTDSKPTPTLHPPRGECHGVCIVDCTASAAGRQLSPVITIDRWHRLPNGNEKGPASTTPRPDTTPRPGTTLRPSTTPRPGATPRPGTTPRPGATPQPDALAAHLHDVLPDTTLCDPSPPERGDDDNESLAHAYRQKDPTRDRSLVEIVDVTAVVSCSAPPPPPQQQQQQQRAVTAPVAGRTAVDTQGAGQLPADSNVEDKTARKRRLRGALWRIMRLREDAALVRVRCGGEAVQTLAVQGRFRLRVVSGTVTVAGYAATGLGRKYHSVFSPGSTSLLTVRCCGGGWSADDVVAFEIKRIGPAENSPYQFISGFGEYETLFRPGVGFEGVDHLNKVSAPLGCKFMYADAPLPVCSFGGNWLSVIAETSRAINLTGTAQVFLVCGGRNVGKSTMARHLINSALSECKRVAYLECDIGQTEFTPSGCISLHIVTTPVIGPPFTHQRKPYRMCYYGHIAAQEDPVHYVACVKYVYQAYVKLRRDRVPLIVNTMGWNRGMGLNLLVDVINITQPTHVVQFVHSSPNKNLPLVNEEFLSCTPGMVYEQRALSNHRHLLVESYEEYHQRKKQYKPEDHRNLSFLAYMGKMLDFTVTGKSLPLEALQPYSLPWSAVGIHVSHAVIPNSLALLSLNASVVALCAADPKEMLSSEDETLPRFFHSTPVCKCFGFGIVRGIDPVQKVFYILTPVPFADLGKVNTLLKGVLEIPSCIMTTQKCQQPLPYVMEARHIPRVLGKESVKRSFKARPKYKRQGGARPSQRKRQP